MMQTFYNDFLFKKQKPKSDILEQLLEFNEHQLVKLNEIQSLYNVSIPTQDDVWICGRIFSENAGNSGKLTDHNVLIQGSYVCSNSHSIPLNLINCNEFSLFPGQIVLANGRNPDGKKFLCRQIVEPSFVSECQRKIKKEAEMESYTTSSSINVKLASDEELSIIVAAGPYMSNGTVLTNNINNLLDKVIEKKAHVLILLGPFVDSNNELIASGNIQYSYEELLQIIFDEIAIKMKNQGIRVIIQPSLNDLTVEPVYPVRPYTVSYQFQKLNDFFHFVQEPSMIKINDIQFAITSTDIIKDLIMTGVYNPSSSDKISRNFAHLLRQRSFYPIYPPPDQVCIDYEAWLKHARIETHPDVFIAFSDLATFNKNVNNCVCLNPGRLVRGTSIGSYVQVTVKPSKNKLDETTSDTKERSTEHPNISVSFHKLNQ